MKKDDATQPAPSEQAQQPAPATPWLTEAEIEALRKNQREALAYAQKMFFPNARIHRAKEDPAEEPEE